MAGLNIGAPIPPMGMPRPRGGNWPICGNMFIWNYGFSPGCTNTVFCFLLPLSESAFLDFLSFFFFLRPEMSDTDFSLVSCLVYLLDFLAVGASEASLSTWASSDCALLIFLGTTCGSKISSDAFFFLSTTLAFFSAFDAAFLGCFSFFSFSRQAFYLQ